MKNITVSNPLEQIKFQPCTHEQGQYVAEHAPSGHISKGWTKKEVDEKVEELVQKGWQKK